MEFVRTFKFSTDSTGTNTPSFPPPLLPDPPYPGATCLPPPLLPMHQQETFERSLHVLMLSWAPEFNFPPILTQQETFDRSSVHGPRDAVGPHSLHISPLPPLEPGFLPVCNAGEEEFYSYSVGTVEGPRAPATKPGRILVEFQL